MHNLAHTPSLTCFDVPAYPIVCSSDCIWLMVETASSIGRSMHQLQPAWLQIAWRAWTLRGGPTLLAVVCYDQRSWVSAPSLKPSDAAMTCMSSCTSQAWAVMQCHVGHGKAIAAYKHHTGQSMTEQSGACAPCRQSAVFLMQESTTSKHTAEAAKLSHRAGFTAIANGSCMCLTPLSFSVKN